MRSLLFLLAFCASAFAQQVPNHSVPIGRGPGVSGFSSAGPCAANQVLIWPDATHDPACSSISGGGITSIITGSTLVTSNSGSVWTVTQGPGFANVMAYGALGDNSHDDTTAIQAAITALNTTGGTVYFPAGIYKITSALTIGNGGPTTQSTINNRMELRGAGQGINLTTPIPGGTTIRYAGGASGGAVIQVNGPITAINFYDMTIDAGGLVTTGMQLTHVRQSNFQNLDVVDWTAFGIILTSYPATGAVSWGCNNNNFTHVNVSTNNVPVGGAGMIIGPDNTGGFILDCAQNFFSTVHISFFSGVTHVGIQLQYTDAGNMLGITTEGTNPGLYIAPPADSLGWPAGYMFYDCFFLGGVQASPSWIGSGMGFLPLAGDGITINYNQGFFGFTNEGINFQPTIRVVNNSNTFIPSGSGMLVITEKTFTGGTATYLLGGGFATLLGTTVANFVAPTTVPGAGFISVAYDGAGRYRIYNHIGGDATFGIAQTWTSSAN